MRVLSIVIHDNAGAGVFGDLPDVEFVEWVPPEDGTAPELDGFDAVMAFGGSMHVDQEERHPWLRAEKALLRDALARGTPLLGVCLGGQLIAEIAGARPQKATTPEIGWYRVEVTEEGRDDPLIGPLAPEFEVMQWHLYEAPLPPGAIPLARNSACLQAFRVAERPAWGLQFHPEVTAADAESWMDEFYDDYDAVASGLDPDVIRAETKARIGAQSVLGRELAGRFVAAARKLTSS
jgi:GMP synthase-like glutamine amidotransferase